MKTLIATSVITALLVGTVHANSTIYTGSEGGTYHKQAIQLGAQLNNSSIQNMSGSMAILNSVNSDDSGVGFAQMDAYALHKADNPNSNVKLVGVLNTECPMVITHVDSKIDDEDDLEQDGVRIAVGNKGSGAEATLYYMGKLDEDYAKIEMVYEDPDLILAQLSGGVSDVDAFMYVSKPSVNNRYAKLVADKANNLKFVPLDDHDMNDKIDGKQVYTFDKVLVEEGLFSDTRVWSPCTNVAVVANKSNPDIGDVAKVIVRNRASLVNVD